MNAVGVDLNTASASLLARVSGLGKSLAEAIVAHRDDAGAFKNRKELLKVARLGNALLNNAQAFCVSPTAPSRLMRPPFTRKPMALPKDRFRLRPRLRSLMGDSAALKALDPRVFVDERFGLPTVRDIIAELDKPGRDPRPEFKTATFVDGIDDIKDLKPGMMLEGTVTNVAAFGAFVDIGVHQDGLVHVSQLADKFVKDPHEVVKAGDVVKVRVTEVDVPRKRIGLTMRKEGGEAPAPRNAQRTKPAQKQNFAPRKQEQPSTGGFGAALLEAMKKK